MTESIIVALISAISMILQAFILHKQHHVEKQQADMQERTEIILEGVEASLIGVKQLGANGRVAESLHKLEAYKNKKAAQ